MFTDGHRAGAVEDLVDRGTDLPARSGLRAPADAVHLGANRRQDVFAVAGVGEPDGCVAGADSAVEVLVLKRQLVAQCAVGVRPAIGE